jgi:hypothetical protein
MAYLVFQKSNRGLYKIYSDDIELNNANDLPENLYIKLIISSSDFNDVQLGIKSVEIDNQNNVIYTDLENFAIQSIEQLINMLNNRYRTVDDFLNNNKNHPDFVKWQNYSNTLNKYIKDKTLFNGINYPLNQTFEQFLKSKGETILNILQLP